MTRKLAPLIVFLLSLSAAAAAEVPVSTPEPVAAPGAQTGPQIASDGTSFLVVWTDSREMSGMPAIWAMRVGADGQPLDPTGIRVSPPDEFGDRNPVVVWTGEWYLVGWTNALSAVETRRVGRDGQLLDAAPQRVINGVLGAAALLDGNVLFVSTRNNAINVWAVDAAGLFINFTVLNQGTSETSPLIAANGRAALLVWLHSGLPRPQVAIAPVSSHGNVAAPRLVDARFPLAVLPNAAGFLVLYQDYDGALIAERVDDSGASLGRNVLPYTSRFTPFGLSAGRLNDGYVVVVPGRTPPGMLLDGTGAYQRDFPVRDTAVAAQTSFATNGAVTLMAWADLRTGDLHIYSHLLGAGGDDVLVSRAANTQRSVVTATAADGAFLAAWVEPATAAGPWQVRARRFTRDGVPLDSDSLFLGLAARGPIAAAFDGADWIVAWVTATVPSDAAYARVAPDGRILDGTPRTAGVPAQEPSAWRSPRTAPTPCSPSPPSAPASTERSSAGPASGSAFRSGSPGTPTATRIPRPPGTARSGSWRGKSRSRRGSSRATRRRRRCTTSTPRASRRRCSSSIRCRSSWPPPRSTSASPPSPATAATSSWPGSPSRTRR